MTLRRASFCPTAAGSEARKAERLPVGRSWDSESCFEATAPTVPGPGSGAGYDLVRDRKRADSPYNRDVTRTAAGLLVAAFLASAAHADVPQEIACPAGLTPKYAYPLIDAFPPIHGASEGQHCRRSDGIPQGPTVAWHLSRRKLAMVGSYCDGQAQGPWSFFWPNGVLAREGTYVGPSLKHGIWRDYDQEGRRLVEIEYAQGREVGKREFPRTAAAPQAVADDRVAIQRYQAALSEPCTAAVVEVRPFRGLREELRNADSLAILRIQAIEIINRPPGWSDMPSPPQHVDAAVVRVLRGSLAPPGSKVRLWVDAHQFNRRFETFAQSHGLTFARPLVGEEMLALVKRSGERVEIRNLFLANELGPSDAAVREYSRLAALDDDGFRLGLARLVADVVRDRPDRLLWMGWARLAFDDWSRLTPGPVGEPRLDAILEPALATAIDQMDALVAGGRDGVNLHELPWLIRLLDEPQRRRLAVALLRVHTIFQRFVDEARKAFDKAHPPGAPSPPEMTIEMINLGAATGAMMSLHECLALCLDPSRPPYATSNDPVERARAFAAGR